MISDNKLYVEFGCHKSMSDETFCVKINKAMDNGVRLFFSSTKRAIRPAAKSCVECHNVWTDLFIIWLRTECSTKNSCS